MVIYMPIIKGRQGEFKALEQLDDELKPDLLPVLEVVPSEKGPAKDSLDFAENIRESLPPGLLIAVDVQYLPEQPSRPRRPMQDIAADLEALRVPMLPVLHLDDSREQLEVAGDAASLHCGRAVVRLGNQLADSDDEYAERGVSRLGNEAALDVEQCDLLLDMFEVRSERDLTRTEPIVRKCLDWAQKRPWRSVTVAAGAMPSSTSGLPTGTATPLQRWDLALWQRTREHNVQFADYGVAHPQMTTKGWRPGPNLRYTAGDSWWIYRWPNGDTHSAMHRLCQTLVASEHWPPEGAAYSWGDAQIAQRAAGALGPGNPTSWRAWSTSHHLASVVSQLNAGPLAR